MVRCIKGLIMTESPGQTGEGLTNKNKCIFTEVIVFFLAKRCR